ncbi:papilin isoform X3 [Takifugu rubripes]|uniref:papilin isoform X3 n=1 Tax=Takifugu rubripes TaxID=31033 RepID=UPI0011457F5A|nr:papilin isoform X3 [Takifugu rubripes]
MLLLLLTLQLLLPPVVLQIPSSDYWDSWGPYGECSRSCGSGVTTRTRRCITSRADGGHNCVGPDKSFRLCNIQECPEGSSDFREDQCSQFDGTDFQGKRYKWLPYYGADNPCELNCSPRGENFFYRHRSAVADGTPCRPGRRDICVDGACKRLGCDNMLESSQQEDPCLQCGGAGQSCYRVHNSFSLQDLQTGYNQMFIIPVGATTISIRETVATRNYLAIKNLRGEYYLNGHWVIEFSRATPIAGTTLYYQRGAEGDNVPESITGRGPTTEPLVVELISQELNQGVEYDYYLPRGRSREGYYWSSGSWSSCSSECGSGYQSRLVFCTIDNEAYPDYLCASLQRPQSNRTCNPHPCPQTRSWRTGEWNSCSVSCGGGSQVRTVECVSQDSAGPRVVEDAVCAAYAEAPPSLQTCNMHTCPDYRVAGWSACSVTCGSGEQSREVTCVDSRGTKVDELSCAHRLRPHPVQRCEMASCPTHMTWHVGDWGLCSRSCGSGSRNREVICSDPERNLFPMHECSGHLMPPTVERCNTQPCHRPQMAPSIQDPQGHNKTQRIFQPYARAHPTAQRPETELTQTNRLYDPHSAAPVPHCSQSYYGCCPDGHTPAGGPQGLGCPRDPAPARPSCTRSSYGCCRDGATASQGPNGEGCEEYVAPAPTHAPSLPAENAAQCRSTTYGCCYDRTTPASGPNGEGCPNPPNHVERSLCSLPRAAGSCSTWVPRYHYDTISSKCVHFWFGNCHGNSNNFVTQEECQRACQVPAPSHPDQRSADAARDASGPDRSPGGGSPSMGGVFTAHGAPEGGARRQASSAATHARRGRIQLRYRRPLPATAAQHSGPAASLTVGAVTIDKSDPSSVEALVGQTVVLPCRVSPPPSSTVSVEWRRDGVPLSSSRHHQQPNGSLLIGPLTKLHSGWFLCVATRGQERDHRYIYLSVTEGSAQPSPTSLPRDGSPRFSIERSGSSLLEMRSGQTARLPCEIVPASALQSVSIQWTKDGQISSDSRYQQLPDGSLSISALKAADAGLFTCTVSTQQQLEQRQLQLRVQTDLRITTAPNNIQVSEGGAARLPCVVSGDNVSIGWSRNGVPVRPDGRSVLLSPDGSLLLQQVKPSDEGTYTCNAYTGIYSVSATAQVHVTRAADAGTAAPPGCSDQPELANCRLIVFARLCSNSYYSSFCCASCTRHSQRSARFAGRRG